MTRHSIPAWASVALLLIAAPTALVRCDRCSGHSHSASRQAAVVTQEKLGRSRQLSIGDLGFSDVVFYCAAGPKAHFAELYDIAKKLQYAVPEIDLHCGFFSSGARLILFFKTSAVDIPLADWPTTVGEESVTACASDVSVPLMFN